MESRDKAPVSRSLYQFSRLVCVGLSVLSVAGGCDLCSGQNETVIHLPAAAEEPLVRWNFSEEKRDGFVLLCRTDGTNFFTTGVINIYFELDCPGDFVPRRVRVSIDAPGISQKHSSYSCDFIDLLPKFGNTYRFIAADCFQTKTRLQPANRLKVGTYHLTGKVFVDDGPSFDFHFEVKVVSI